MFALHSFSYIFPSWIHSILIFFFFHNIFDENVHWLHAQAVENIWINSVQSQLSFISFSCSWIPCGCWHFVFHICFYFWVKPNHTWNWCQLCWNLEKVNLCGNCVIYIRCSLCILNHLHTVKGVLLINQKHLFKTYCEKHTKPKTWKNEIKSRQTWRLFSSWIPNISWVFLNNNNWWDFTSVKWKIFHAKEILHFKLLLVCEWNSNRL